MSVSVNAGGLSASGSIRIILARSVTIAGSVVATIGGRKVGAIVIGVFSG